MCVYGGHVDNLYGDIVMLTTHQLFRYYNYFDLVIMDEIDAFPYKGNEVLKSFFERACKKNYVLMSATPSKETIKQFQCKGFAILELFSRFHNNPLPVPIVKYGHKLILFLKLVSLLKSFIKGNKPVFIFAPTKRAVPHDTALL